MPKPATWHGLLAPGTPDRQAAPLAPPAPTPAPKPVLAPTPDHTTQFAADLPTATTCALPAMVQGTFPRPGAPAERGWLTPMGAELSLPRETRSVVWLVVTTLSQYTGVPPARILDKRATAAVTRARHACWWVVLHAVRGLSVAALARWWGVHHTSILYGRDKVQDAVDGGADPDWARTLHRLVEVGGRYHREMRAVLPHPAAPDDLAPPTMAPSLDSLVHTVTRRRQVRTPQGGVVGWVDTRMPDLDRAVAAAAPGDLLVVDVEIPRPHDSPVSVRLRPVEVVDHHDAIDLHARLEMVKQTLTVRLREARGRW